MSEVRTLGIDYGEKRVGLALSDPLGLTAQPLALIERENDGQVIEALDALVREHEVGRIVVGLPLSLSGGDSARTRRTRLFIRRLKGRLRLPVETWDERLSTAEADRTLREMAVPPGRRRAQRDVISAQLILQGFVDRRRTESARRP
ncbi:MAG: Holliday junction resolvase RuvX [bacterium]